MPASAEDITRDQNERSNLERAIADVETALPVSTPGARQILQNSLEGMKGRLTTLDKKISEAIKEREVQAREQAAAVAMLAEKETRLNESEKRAYSSFLKEDFFTKKDFGKLDEFYQHSYDRLSDGGKDEMSKRIHQGIRRGEFKFTDLPERIQEKDNEHCSAKADRKVSAQTQVSKIREDSEPPANSPDATTAKKIDIGSVDLSGIKLAEATGTPSAAALPDLSGSKINQR